MNKFHMTASRVRNIGRLLGRQRVMVIGDSMLDRYIWGDVNRISPEAPVPVVQVQRVTNGFGGAANVARNLRTLEVEPFLLSICGADENAEILKEMLTSIGCSTQGIVTSRSRPTTVKTRVIARHQQIVRIDNEVNTELSNSERKALIRIFEKHLLQSDAVIISDYSKGLVCPSFISYVISACSKAGKFVAIDPKIRHFDYYRGVDVITPNLMETHAALGLPIHHRTDDEVQEMGWKLLDMLNLKNLLITLSERGMALFQKKGRVFNHLPTEAREVYDVTGAGDTVISVFTAAICCKASPIEAAFMANHAAGITVAEVGTSSVTASQLVKKCCT
jgi:D-beta-D-heptose 7-phosphate kinase/D-beta-D-heptose 1-phosphate adenosyltransferase